MKLLLLSVCVLGCVLPSLSMRKQTMRVKGLLMCGNKPANNVRVRLYDEDTGPDPDDKLDEGWTNTQGKFDLKGSTRELGTIDPVLKIYHDCNDGKPCQRKWALEIPDKYINDNKGIDIGTWNLELELKDEDRDCNNFFK